MNDTQTLSATKTGGASAHSPKIDPHRILVVDDDSDIRHFNADVLTGCGYEVDTAEDGAAAWETIQLNNYDLMVTDNNMPNLSGIELLIKLDAAGMSLPTIMATGTLPTAEFVLYPWLQPSITLLKPYTLQELLEAVRTIFTAESTSAYSKLLTSQDLNYKNIPQVSERAVASQKCPANPAHRILVVDEDQDLRWLYSEVLAGSGYDVDGAQDGIAGWDALQSNSYELLITDHDLSKLNGIQLVRKLRAAHMTLPVVMAATTLPTHELHRDVSLQLAATLQKPFGIDALVDTVKSVLHAPLLPVRNWQGEPAATGFRC